MDSKDVSVGFAGESAFYLTRAGEVIAIAYWSGELESWISDALNMPRIGDAGWRWFFTDDPSTHHKVLIDDEDAFPDNNPLAWLMPIRRRVVENVVRFLWRREFDERRASAEAA